MGKKIKKIKVVARIACISIDLAEPQPIKNKMLNPKELEKSPQNEFSLSLNGGAEYNHARKAPISTNTKIGLEKYKDTRLLSNKTIYEDTTAVFNGIELSE